MIMRYGPIAYFPIWSPPDSSVAVDISGYARDGTHDTVSLGQPGFGDGKTSGLYDPAVTSNTDVSVLAPSINGNAGSICTWARVRNLGVWSDAVLRALFYVQVDAANYIVVRKSGSVGTLISRYRASGTNFQVSQGGYSTVEFFHVAITWDQVTKIVRVFFNGAQVGGNITITKDWTGAPAVAFIGGAGTSTQNWNGWLQHTVFFDYALTPATVASFYRTPATIIPNAFDLGFDGGFE